MNWVRDLVLLGVVGLLIAFVVWLRAIFEPLFLAILFAYLLNPIVKAIEGRLGIGRALAVGALFGATVLVAVGLAFAIVPLAISQFVGFAKAAPVYAMRLSESVGVTDDKILEQIREKGQEFVENPFPALSYAWNGVVTSLGMFSGAFASASTVLLGVGLFPVYLYAFSCCWPSMVEWARRFVPSSCCDEVNEVARKMDHAVGRYFRTRLIIALVMGILYAIGWGLAGVPFWLLLGILAGLFGIVPYGSTFIWAAAILLRFLDLENGIESSWDVAAVFVWPSLVYALVQASDDWFLTPWLQGNELDMSFVAIILSVLVGGAAAGLLGMLLAVPAAACVRILWTDVVEPRLLRFTAGESVAPPPSV